MAFVNIENSAISIQIKRDESVTVPDGEVWKATVVFQNDSSTNSFLTVNGVNIAFANNITSPNFNTFFIGGDTITTQMGSTTRGAHISGFVVQQL